MLDSSLFDFDLPESAIAQEPASSRSDSKLLLVDRAAGHVSSCEFSDLAILLRRPHAIYRNSVSVMRARLKATRGSGEPMEVLLIKPEDEQERVWQCMVRPGRRIRKGSPIGLPDGSVARVQDRQEDGTFTVDFGDLELPSVRALAAQYGKIPLPPYIRREDDDERASLDAERYETVYADPNERHAIAAPTAGLHFDDEVLQRLRDHDHQIFDLRLHVGPSTFRPIKTQNVLKHDIGTETYYLPPETRHSLNSGSPQGLPRLAVGTTSLRALEDYALREPDHSRDGFRAEAEVFITPPYNFSTEALLTNFHLPKSTLICLVAAFLTPGSTEGIKWIKDIYAAALRAGFRFYSYGDAMLIV